LMMRLPYYASKATRVMQDLRVRHQSLLSPADMLLPFVDAPAGSENDCD
jgi:hypothetical protein